MKNKIFYSLFGVALMVSCTSDSENELYSAQELKAKGKSDKVYVCHYDKECDEYKTLHISENALDAHLRHGDFLGPCETDSDGDGVFDYLDECPDTPANAQVDEKGCPVSPVYLADNGVTVKCFEWAEVGDSGEINGVTYTIVDEAMLREMVDNGEDVTQVCTCKVTDMSELFMDKPDFNQDISSWDVGQVTSMYYMFLNAESFNQPIGNWDVSQVTDMRQLFSNANSFNQPIGDWDVSNVTTMRRMFKWARSFNQPIGNWDVSKVTVMRGMFDGARAFNQPIGDWDVSNVTSMRFMFYNALAFDQAVGDWDTGNVRDMSNMFLAARSFNQPIGDWDVSNVTEMRRILAGAILFNQDLGAWDVSNVTLCSDFDLNTPQWTLPKPGFTNCTP